MYWRSGFENKCSRAGIELPYAETLEEIDECINNWEEHGISWVELSAHQYLSEEFIERHANKLRWSELAEHQVLSEAFIEKHIEKFDDYDWAKVAQHQVLSEEFIERHINSINWNHICWYQRLSIDFIERFNNKVNWDGISHTQYLPLDFIKKYAYAIVPCKNVTDCIKIETFLLNTMLPLDMSKLIVSFV